MLKFKMYFMGLLSLLLNNKMVNVRRKNIFYLLKLKDYVSLKIFLTGTLEKNDSVFTFNLLKEGDVAIDIGANIGYYTLNFSKILKNSGKVFAFEANKLNYHILSINAIQNNFNNIQIHNKIISNTRNYFKENLINNDSGLTYYTKDSNEFESSKGVLLDDYLDDISKINKRVRILKIDVEGAEYLILKSAEKLLDSNFAPEYILIELYQDYLKRFDSSIEDVISFLKGKDYLGPYVVKNSSLVELNIVTGLESIDGNFFFIKNIKS